MNKFALALAGSLLATAAVAQTTTPSTATPATPTRPMPAMTAPPVAPTTGATTGSTMGATTGSTMGTTAGTTMSPAGTPGTMSRMNGTAAASGNSNQAVATTAANAPQPAHGRNSFTRGEARRRLEKQGFATVADLKKDAMGVWRGTGMKDGAKVNVWLDYKGNIGQS